MCDHPDLLDRLGSRIVDALAGHAHQAKLERVQLVDELRSILRTAVPTLPRSAAVWRSGSLTGLSTTTAMQVAGRNLARVSIVVQNTSASGSIYLAPTKNDAELKGSTCLVLAAGAAVTIDTTAEVWAVAAGANAAVNYFATETDA